MATLIAQRSSYWVRTNTNTPGFWDYRAFFNIYYSQTEEDKKNNRSEVIVEYYRQEYLGQYSAGEEYNEWPATYIDCAINGVSIGSAYVAGGINVNSGYRLIKIATKSTYVYHDDNGNASFTFYGSGWGKGTGTSVYGLPQINVTTKIANNTNENSRIDFGKLVTFNLTRPNASVTEELKYTINDVEYSIPITSNGEKEQEITYKFPTTLIEFYPNTDKPYIQVNLISSNGTKSSTNVYLNIDDTYKPTIGIPMLTDVMENKPEALMELWIKNKSKVFCSTNITPQANATITNFSATISDFPQMYIENPFTTQPLSVSGERIISINVLDSRGKKSTKEHSFNVIDYNTPSIEGKVERCLSDGTLNENGTYGKITVKYKVYPLNNGTNNLNTFTIKMTNGQTYTLNKGNYEDTITQVINLALSSSKSYKFTFEIVDIFGEPIIVEYILGVANKTISLRKGGKGVTLGKIATADGFHVYMDSTFYNPVKVNNNINVTGNYQKDGSNLIVNNLTTKDANRALSANQGNVIGNQINALNEKINKMSSYSTEEKVVGTWVDGRPLYEKTIIGNGILYAGATLLAHNVSNIGETRFFVSAYYRFINGGTNNGYYTGQWVNSTSYVTVQHITSTGIEIQCGTNWAQLFIPHVTIRYTKTTDAATIDVSQVSTMSLKN